MRRGRVVAVRAVLGVVVAGVVFLATGCSGGTGSTTGSTEAATTLSSTTVPVDTLAPATVVEGDEAKVRAVDNDFEPKHLQITAGTAVTFVNAGHNKHNVIPIDPAAPRFAIADHDFATGASVTSTFTEPGTWAYYCSLHATPTAGSMRGVITVTP